MARRSNVHVSKDEGRWKVTQRGSKLSSHKKQTNAIQAGRRESEA